LASKILNFHTDLAGFYFVICDQPIELIKTLIDSTNEIASFLAMTKIPYEKVCPSPDRSGNPFLFFL